MPARSSMRSTGSCYEFMPPMHPQRTSDSRGDVSSRRSRSSSGAGRPTAMAGGCACHRSATPSTFGALARSSVAKCVRSRFTSRSILAGWFASVSSTLSPTFIADAQAHGVPTIRDSIRAACKAGRDNCERKNPQGRCCLGNVGLVLKSAPAPPTDGGDGDCCAADGASSSHHQSGDAPDDAGRVGLIASSGAVVVALLASACCWLPLVALGLGASVAGVGGVLRGMAGPAADSGNLLGRRRFLLVVPDPSLRPRRYLRRAGPTCSTS